MDQSARIEVFPLPKDLTDHFVMSSWHNPYRYLNPQFRNATSAFSLSDQLETLKAVNKLAIALESGEWINQYRDILNQTTLDVGYRFLVSKYYGK